MTTKGFNTILKDISNALVIDIASRPEGLSFDPSTGGGHTVHIPGEDYAVWLTHRQVTKALEGRKEIFWKDSTCFVRPDSLKVMKVTMLVVLEGDRCCHTDAMNIATQQIGDMVGNQYGDLHLMLCQGEAYEGERRHGCRHRAAISTAQVPLKSRSASFVKDLVLER